MVWESGTDWRPDVRPERAFFVEGGGLFGWASVVSRGRVVAGGLAVG